MTALLSPAPWALGFCILASLTTAACGGDDSGGTLTAGEHGYAPAPESDGGPTTTSATGSDGGHAADGAPAMARDANVPQLGVLSLTLLDASVTGQIKGAPVAGFDPIANGATMSLAKVGSQLSVRANVDNVPVGSVEFQYDDQDTTENKPPFMLCGNDGAGGVTDCKLAAGPHTVIARAYSGPDRTGLVGKTVSISFTLTP